MLDAEDVLELMNRVGYEVDPEIDRIYPEKWRAWARVGTRSGDSFYAEIDEPKGDPGNWQISAN